MKPSVAKLLLTSLLLFFNLILTSPTYTSMVSAYDDNHHLENPDNRYNKTIYHSIKAGGGGGSSGGGGRGGGGSSSGGGGGLRGGSGSSSGGRGGSSGTGSRGSGGGRAGSGGTGSSGMGAGGVIGGGIIAGSGRGDGGTNNRDGRSVSSVVDNGLPLIVVVTAVTTSLIVSFSSFIKVET